MYAPLSRFTHDEFGTTVHSSAINCANEEHLTARTEKSRQIAIYTGGDAPDFDRRWGYLICLMICIGFWTGVVFGINALISMS
jgi:hypothetical protein